MTIIVQIRAIQTQPRQRAVILRPGGYCPGRRQQAWDTNSRIACTHVSSSAPIDNGALAGPSDSIAKLDDALLVGLQLRLESDNATLVVEAELRRLRGPEEVDPNLLVQRDGDLVEHDKIHGALVLILYRDAKISAVGARRRDEAGLAPQLLDDGMAHAHPVVGTKANLVLLARRQHGKLADTNEVVDVPGVGERGSRKLSRQTLAEVIEPRVEELYTLVQAELRRSGYEDLISSGVVITGGSSALPGMGELGEEVFHTPVRVGMPQYVGGLAEVVRNPRYSTAVGLLLAGLDQHQRHHIANLQTGSVTQLLQRMKSWFQGNF